MNHTIKITTLTPVHIGNGAAMNPDYEYLQFAEEGLIAVVDEDKVFDLIQGNVGHWVNAIEKEESLLELIQTWRPDVQAADCAKRTIYINHAPSGAGKIQEQLRVAMQEYPTIPGSSLKGAFRTAVLTHLIQKNKGFVQRKKNLGTSRKGRFSFNDKQINAYFFGKKDRIDRDGNIQLDANKDWFRFLRFSDTHFQDLAQTEVNRIIILNQMNKGWGEKKQETSYWECLPQGASATGRIQIPADLIQQNRNKRLAVPKAKLLDIQELFRIINDHTYKLIGEEMDYWEDEGLPAELGSYFEELETLYNTLETCSEKECILRIGAGSGWKFMTGAWAMDEQLVNDDTWDALKDQMRRGRYRNMVFPKSRKLISGGMPLGFVKMELG